MWRYNYRGLFQINFQNTFMVNRGIILCPLDSGGFNLGMIRASMLERTHATGLCDGTAAIYVVVNNFLHIRAPMI